MQQQDHDKPLQRWCHSCQGKEGVGSRRRETTTSTGLSEAALQKARFELYDKDLPKVKEVHARILGLQEGEEATQEDFDSSPDFQLRWAADETHPPTVIGEYWINHLDS